MKLNLFAVVVLLPVFVSAKPTIFIDEKDMVKDTDIFNDAVLAENAARVEEDIKNEGPAPKVEVIIDGSGSMAQILSKNKTKMYYLKELMKPFFRAQWKEKNNIGLRIYGGQAKAKCEDTRMVVPFGKQNLSMMERALSTLEPQGMTPLHDSITEAIKDLKGHPGPKRVVIVTDGEDTCGGDPCKTTEDVLKEQLDLKFYVVALGFKGESTSLQKVKCMGDTSVADDDESLAAAMGNISSKLSGRQNLEVISPNPSAAVYLYQVKEDGKRVLFRVFYANSPQAVPPGTYEAVVGLQPAFKFSEFKIPPNKKVTLKISGDGIVKVNFFNSFLNVEVLDKNNRVVKRFKSDVPTEVPTGTWRFRIFRSPFYEFFQPDTFIYPKGKHEFDINGLGVLRVDSKNLQGLYVYNDDKKLLGEHLTQSPAVLKAGVYTLHVNDKCTFPKVQLFDRKEVLVVTCPNE